MGAVAETVREIERIKKTCESLEGTYDGDIESDASSFVTKEDACMCENACTCKKVVTCKNQMTSHDVTCTCRKDVTCKNHVTSRDVTCTCPEESKSNEWSERQFDSNLISDQLDDIGDQILFENVRDWTIETSGELLKSKGDVRSCTCVSHERLSRRLEEENVAAYGGREGCQLFPKKLSKKKKRKRRKRSLTCDTFHVIKSVTFGDFKKRHGFEGGDSLRSSLKGSGSRGQGKGSKVMAMVSRVLVALKLKPRPQKMSRDEDQKDEEENQLGRKYRPTRRLKRMDSNSSAGSNQSDQSGQKCVLCDKSIQPKRLTLSGLESIEEESEDGEEGRRVSFGDVCTCDEPKGRRSLERSDGIAEKSKVKLKKSKR